METLIALVGTIGMIAVVVSIILMVISTIKKDGLVKKHLKIMGVGFALFIVAAIATPTETPSTPKDVDLAAGQKEVDEEPKKEEPKKEEPKKEEPKKEEPKKEKISTEYKNALNKAKTYSDFMHMSKMGIYDQLTSEYGENFPADAAQYAVDNLNANYKENALSKAKVYYEQMSMSKSGVYDQLVSEYGEKFTAEEAQYAVDNLD